MPDKSSEQLPAANTPLFASGEKIAKVNVADEIKNSFLLDVRDHFARTAGCARRSQTFVTPHSFRDE